MKKIFIYIWIVICIQRCVTGFGKRGLPCALRQVQYGLVCVCNNTYCDTLEFDEPKNVGDYTIVSSSKAGLRFNVGYGQFKQTQHKRPDKATHIDDKILSQYQRESVQTLQVFNTNQLRKRSGNGFQSQSNVAQTENVVFTVDHDETFQKVVGFGGAITGSVDFNLDQMSEVLRKTIYKLYYSKTVGLGFNMMRLTIGGCDFDLKAWVYNELPENDRNLTNFTSLNDRDFSIIAKINDLKQTTGNHDIKLMGAAWGSPNWMKTSKRWDGPSLLLPQYYQAWADYHLRFLQLMQQQNMTFWAISTGNEPMNGIFGWVAISWLNLGWLPHLQAKFVAHNLGPTLRHSGFGDVKIFAGDDQRYIFPKWFAHMKATYPKSMDYLDGFAVHWYWDRVFPSKFLDDTHRQFPNKVILNTESCMGDNPFDGLGPHIGSWQRGEYYTRDIINNLKHWVTGWIDWNIILDEQGGPNYVDNKVDAPILVNTTSGLEIYKQPIYYALGHFSRFIPPDSVRIGIKSTHLDVTVVAFKRPDGSTVMVLQNEKYKAINLTINDPNRGSLEIDVPAKSMHTIVYK